MSEIICPQEVIASVLCNLPKGKKYLPTELRQIHPIFYQMRHKCSNIMEEFTFDKRGTFVYSESIDQAFSNLETSKVLPRVNPDLDRYEITKKLKNYYRDRVDKKLSPIQREEITKIATELAKIAFRA